MYQVELLNISIERANAEALQLLEDILAPSQLQNYDGIFSVALSELFSSVQNRTQKVDIEYLIDNHTVKFNFHFSESENILDNLTEESSFILSKLVDDFSYNSENNTVTFLFHVKRQPLTPRMLQDLNRVNIETLINANDYEM
jgi:hypothetical protein